ncbi:MAG: ParA family protein [Ruminococcaceae bacterium]|nr:ParA family protein [Oscillospiraceae bacterium]
MIPVQVHYLSAKGMTQLVQTVSKVKRQINRHLKIDGILLTLVDERTNLAISTRKAVVEIISQCRRNKELTQKQVASLINISNNHLLNIFLPNLTSFSKAWISAFISTTTFTLLRAVSFRKSPRALTNRATSTSTRLTTFPKRAG